ncbi:hypothetical protein SDC9_122891 [bioreactor metagenome]|uniref:Uncharacterized protein n=1 Tax=bioreactor metagenome TaxID=1076179 RepID=A0A645CG22_9ZZZZ
MLIAGIADENATEHLVNLFMGWIAFMFEQPNQEQRSSWSIVSTLHHTGVDHGLLNHMEAAAGPQRFCGPDHCTFSLHGKHQVRIHRNIVVDNGITSCKTFLVIAVTYALVTQAYQN